MYDVLSPDGFSIDPEAVYPDRDTARAAAAEFAKRFVRQGYYKTARWERIPPDEVAGRCRIVEVPDDYLECE
jgi:hypothetical protein